MKRARLSFHFALLVIAACSATLVGCGGGGASAGPSGSHVAIYAQLFEQCRTRMRGQPVSTVDDVRSATATSPLLDGSSLDDIIVSDRDKQPLKLLFGDDIIVTEDGTEIVAYEVEGVDGVRYAATMGGIAIEMNDAEFNAAVGS